jgi:imidazolonepropionase-like amidohydrolase
VGIFAALIEADVSALGSADQRITDEVIRMLARDTVWVCPTLTDSRAYAIMKDSAETDPRFASFHPGLKTAWLADIKGMRDEDIAGLKLLFPNALRLVGLMHKAGVPLLAGTDAGSTYDFPGSDLHNELALMVRAGLTPLEALRTATLNPARALGMTDSIGRIAPGMLADLVLLDADPLVDIRNTTRIAKVVAAGRVIE